jgi:hypothetical protein
MVFIVFLLLVVFVLIIKGTNFVDVKEVKIRDNKIKGCIRIVHISDIHGKTRYLNGSISSIINKYCVDYVILTGDLCNNSAQLENVMEELKKIKVNKRILIILGNYERTEVSYLRKKETDIIKKLVGYNSNKIKILINQYEVMEDSHNKILFYGFDNSVYGNESYNNALNEEKFTYRILFAHSPNIIDYIEKRGIPFDIILAGHTHGNQWNIPFVCRIWNKYPRFPSGVNEYDGKHIIISRGLGTSRIPIRINSNPDISIYDLCGKECR